MSKEISKEIIKHIFKKRLIFISLFKIKALITNNNKRYLKYSIDLIASLFSIKRC